MMLNLLVLLFLSKFLIVRFIKKSGSLLIGFRIFIFNGLFLVVFFQICAVLSSFDFSQSIFSIWSIVIRILR
ncbi:hypothetical protein DBZ44_11360 [Listeria monocytogenes]|nr:hypothetical protein [Listeria monocytogenes]